MPILSSNSTLRRERLFQNGANQAVRIPREFEFEGEEVLLRREGNQLVIEPAEQAGLLETLGRLEPLEEDLPDWDEDPLSLDDPKI